MTEGLRLRLYYALAGVLAWLAYGVLGLRRSVVRGNLRVPFRSGPRPSIELPGANSRDVRARWLPKCFTPSTSMRPSSAHA